MNDGDSKPKLRPKPPTLTGEHPTLTEVPAYVPAPPVDWKVRAQDLERALTWALRFVRLPVGTDVETWAADYNTACDLIGRKP